MLTDNIRNTHENEAVNEWSGPEYLTSAEYGPVLSEANLKRTVLDVGSMAL